MTAQCVPFAQGRRLRVTKLNNCGVPDDEDTCARVVSSGFVQVSASSDVVNGTNIEPLNANGDLCYQLRSPDIFTRHQLQIEFCEVDPTLFSMVVNANQVVDWNDDVVGFQTVQGAATSFYALEVWMGVPGVDCPEQTGDFAVDSLGYVLFPLIVPGALGDFKIANDRINFTVSGFTRGNGNWGQGPYDVVAQDALNTPGPLIDALPSDVHAHLQYTTVPAPDAFCGCEPLSDSPS
jgi:hypothetical protein